MKILKYVNLLYVRFVISYIPSLDSLLVYFSFIQL